MMINYGWCVFIRKENSAASNKEMQQTFQRKLEDVNKMMRKNSVLIKTGNWMKRHFDKPP